MGFLKPATPKIETPVPPPSLETEVGERAAEDARRRAVSRRSSEDTVKVGGTRRASGGLGAALRATIGGE